MAIVGTISGLPVTLFILVICLAIAIYTSHENQQLSAKQLLHPYVAVTREYREEEGQQREEEVSLHMTIPHDNVMYKCLSTFDSPSFCHLPCNPSCQIRT